MKKAIVKLALLGSMAAGCATPSSGGEASGISIINSPHARVEITGDGNGTATAAPESEGTSASATFSPEVSVPVK